MGLNTHLTSHFSITSALPYQLQNGQLVYKRMYGEFINPLKVEANCYLCGNKSDAAQMCCLLTSVLCRFLHHSVVVLSSSPKLCHSPNRNSSRKKLQENHSKIQLFSFPDISVSTLH